MILVISPIIIIELPLAAVGTHLGSKRLKWHGACICLPQVLRLYVMAGSLVFLWDS